MTVVAIVPCRNGGNTLGETVTTLINEPGIDAVLVVDDGSTDDTAAIAFNAGAQVHRLERNQGKAAAMVAGINAAPQATTYLFVDADTGKSARGAIHLLPPVLDDQVDMTVAVLPSAEGKGGFGLVKNFAEWGIYRGARARVRAPLSGQRAVNGQAMRDLIAKHGLAHRFGVEVAMTIDALNDGLRVAEVEVDMTHDHRGRGAAGFAHRANQGKDILRALWYRAIPRWVRVLPLALVTALVLVICGAAAASHQNDASKALPRVEHVKVVLVPDATWADARDSAVMGSVVTGKTDDAFSVVAAGSRAKDALQSPDVDITAAAKLPVAVSQPTLVVGFTTKGGTKALRPLMLLGVGDVSGTLTSPSTKRAGLVDITDIAPTVLTMEGKPVPSTMTGTAARVASGVPSGKQLSSFDKLARFYDHINPIVILMFVLVQVFAYLWALYVARSNKELPGAARVATAVAAFPLATYVTRFIQVTNGYLWFAVTALVVAAIAYGAERRIHDGDALNALQRILLVTIAFMVGDVLTGSHLQLSGVFGSSPTLGSRYHGLGNPASELMLLATVLWCGIHVQRARMRKDALWLVAAMLLIVTVVIGAPGLGSDVGGLLAMVCTSVGLLAALHFKKLSWSWVGIAAIASVAAIGLAAFIDYQRAPDARTHLGRLLARVINEGPSPLFDTIGRKIDANVLAYGFPWSLGVMATVAFMLIGLLRGKWATTFPVATAARIALVAALVGSCISYAVNDSGVVVLSLIAVFVGPFVLVEFRHRRNSLESTGSNLEVVVP